MICISSIALFSFINNKCIVHVQANKCGVTVYTLCTCQLIKTLKPFAFIIANCMVYKQFEMTK